MKPDTCTYKKKVATGYYTEWISDCNESIRCEAPIEVGMSFAPLPNEYGKYCHFCGKRIKLAKETK